MTAMKRKSNSESVATLLAAGDALMAAGDLPAAIHQLQRALALDPGSDAANYALGCAWLQAGEAERAIANLSKLSASPNWAARAGDKIAEGQAMARANRSPAPYVRHLFDQFAPDYDKRMLGELSYCAPQILRGLADMLVAAEPGTLDILDLGCGTGLAGKAFKDLARRLDGVDLSPGMIAQARAADIYDELVVADAQSLLAGDGRCYDLILAADVMVYLGDLAGVFRGAARRLGASGFFLFTVEKSHQAEYERGPKRRYRHSPTYLREEAARAGLQVMGILDCSPRQDAGIPVEGFAVALQHA
jgi:predicted TPR repeat methyltransferase